MQEPAYLEGTYDIGADPRAMHDDNEDIICHMMAGLPGSGKSRFARSIHALRFNLDDYRDMMGSHGRWNRDREDVAQAAMIKAVVTAVDSGFDVVIDNTNMTPRLPNQIRVALAMRPVTFRVHDLSNVPIETCIQRDLERGEPETVGENVIRDMWERHRSAVKNGWHLTDRWMNEYRSIIRRIKPYPYTSGLPDVAVFDLDGNLALRTERGPLDFDRCGEDVLNEAVAKLYRALAESGMGVPIMTGRPSCWRMTTCDWLDRVMQEEMTLYDPDVYMRPGGDVRPDFIVKSELIEKFLRGKVNIVMAFDDRDQMVELWRLAYKLPCMQSNYGAF